MKRSIAAIVLPVFLSLLFMCVQAYAQDKDQITSSMRDRYPALQDAMNSGYAGETWTGLVGVVDAGAPSGIREMVEAENRDRVALFQIIARETGTSVEEVARQNRIRMYRLADDTHFLQDQNRQWVQKKDLK